MFKTLFMSAVIFAAGTAMATETDSPANRLTFQLSFEKHFTPEVAKGSPMPFFDKNRPPEFEFVPGYIGQGFQTGRKGHYAGFRTGKNLQGEEGTLTLWQKYLGNLEFGWTNRDQYCFIMLNDSKRETMFYKFGPNDRPWFYDSFTSSLGQKTATTIFLPKLVSGAEHGWHQYSFTWKGTKMACYLDGILVDAKDRPEPFLPSTEKGAFYIGQQWGTESPESNRIMDEVKIYNKAFSPAEIYKLHLSERQTVPPQLATAAPAPAAVKIDGIYDEKEYANAAAVPLLFNNGSGSVAEVPSFLYVTYDRNNLYLFLKAPIGSKFFEDAHTTLLHGMFRTERLSHDLDVDLDDSLSIHFFRENVDYYLCTNTADTLYDYTTTDQKEMRLAWNPAWQAKSVLSEHGWFQEIAIPLKALNFDPAAPGARLEANFCRNWKHLKVESDSWGLTPRAGQGWKPDRPGDSIVFAGNDTLVVRLDRIERLNTNSADFTLTLSNPSGSVKKAHVQLSAGFGESAFSETVEVPAGKSVPVRIQKNFNRPVMNLHLNVSSPDRKKQYFELNTPVFSLEDVELIASPLPSSGKLLIAGRFPQLNLEPANSAVKIAIRQDDKLFREMKIDLKQLEFSREISVSDLPDGKYSVELEILEKGRSVATRSISYEKQPLPEWYGNTIGISDKVPAPWSPMKAAGAVVSFSERSYDFGNSVLPETLLVKGENILASPIRFEVAAGGTAENIRVSNRITDAKDIEVNVAGSGSNSVVTVDSSAKIEFDGFMWNRITVTPRQPGVKLDSLRVVIPLKKEYGELLCPYDYTLKTTGYLTRWNGSIRPIWVGNADRGISFVAEHQYNWKLDNVEQALEIGHENGICVMRINLAAKPFSLDQPEVFEFGLQTTPVKPLNPERRKYRYLSHSTLSYAEGDRNSQFLLWWHQYWGINPADVVFYPIAKPGLKPSDLAWKLKNGNTAEFVSYYQLHEMWQESPEFKQFAYEWIKDSTIPVSPESNPDKRQVSICQAARSANDFVLWGLQKYARQVNLKGLYFDLSQPRTCVNGKHGCGYQVNGQTQPTFNVRGARELVKRIYVMLQQNRSDALIIYHNSGQICTPVHGFAEALVDGENFNSLLHKHRGYQEILRPDVYKAEYMCTNFGCNGAFLAFFKPSEVLVKALKTKEWTPEATAEYDELARHQNYVLGLGLLHDNQTTSGWLPHRETAQRGFHIYSAMDYSNAKLDFVPYWKNPLSGFTEKEVICSIYVDKPGQQATLIVMNMGEQPRSFTFKPDWKTLGLGVIPTQIVHLEYPETGAALKNGVISTFAIPPKEYRAFIVKK